MAFFLKRRYGMKSLSGMGKLAIIIFLVSLSSSFNDTIWAVYLDGFLHSASLVGFFSGFLSVLAFASSFLFVPWIAKSNKSKLYSFALILTAVFYLIFAINKNVFVFMLVSVLVTFTIAIKLTTVGIIIRDESDKKSISKNEGVIYSFNNVAWVVGPLIAGFILVELGVSFVFLGSAGLVLLGFLLFRISGINDENKVKKIKGGAIKNFFEFFRDKDRVLAYFMTSGVTLWWSLIYLYVPLFIINNGLGEGLIGVFLFLTALPLIILEYPFSKLAGKKGAKRLFLIAYPLLIAITIAAFFASSIYIVLGLLVFGSLALSMLEPTTEAYFFDIIKNKKDENRFYGPYSTSIETGLIIGKFIPAIILLFLPFKSIFILYSALFLALFILAMKTKLIIEDGKRK